MRVEDQLQSGRAALADGRWADAKAAFTATLAIEERAEALDGLGQALHWLGEFRAAVDFRVRAYHAFRARGETRYAAVLAAYWLAFEQVAVFGNSAAAAGWLARGVRLAEACGDCPERGWVELARSMVTDDLDAKQSHVDRALEIARRFGDPDLEFDAMSYAGVCQVARGQIGAGMALLDESVAAATAGEVRSVGAAGEIYCKMLLACELAMDVRRAEQWTSAAEEFVQRTNFLGVSGICRMHYGGLLTLAGRWEEAERELTGSLKMYDASYRGLRAGSLARLAELRVRQNRLEEAAQLLAGQEHDSYAIRPLTRLHLRRGETELAVTVLRRHLRAAGDGVLEVPAMALLVEAELAAGRTAEAGAVCRRLIEAIGADPSPLVAAFAAFVHGLVAAADLTSQEQAREHFERALAGFREAGLPIEEARSRLQLARLLSASQPAVAIAEARAALRLFEQVGAAAESDVAAALLRSLGSVGRIGRRGLAPLSQREAEVLRLIGAGLSNPEIAARLFISRKTASHHVSAVLAKLGLRNRSEAAAYVSRTAEEKF